MTKNRPQIDCEASCACGASGLKVTGPIHSMFLCTCSDCQKATGSGHAAIAIAGMNDVALTGAEPVAFARPARSGARLTRHFCPKCGVTLYAQSSRREDLILLPAGLFGGNDWFIPNQVIFHKSHLDWDTLPDVPKYQTYREEEKNA